MIKRLINPLLSLACTISLLSGCSLVQQQPSTQVEVIPNTFISLPLPQQLEQVLNVSQLISANWRGETHQLPVQLAVDSSQVVLVGFSSWGTRILSVVYSEQKIESEVLSGLGVSLPDPEQVLFYLMLTLWPQEAWQAKLEPLNWQLLETDSPNSPAWRRSLLDQHGQAMVTIDYQRRDKLAGTIQLENKLSGYKITIQTLTQRDNS